MDRVVAGADIGLSCHWVVRWVGRFNSHVNVSSAAVVVSRPNSEELDAALAVGDHLSPQSPAEEVVRAVVVCLPSVDDCVFDRLTVGVLDFQDEQERVEL